MKVMTLMALINKHIMAPFSQLQNVAQKFVCSMCAQMGGWPLSEADCLFFLAKRSAIIAMSFTHARTLSLDMQYSSLT